jgi:serine protease
VAGLGGVPANATGVTGNVTVVNETNAWAVFVGPVATSRPPTSTLNFNVGDVVANGVTVALGTGGKLSVTYISTLGNTTDLVFDVTGYFVP